MKKITWFIIMALTILWTPHAPLAGTGTSKKINWATYDGAQSRNSENRKYFIYFYTEQCGFCTRLEKITFSDQAVIDYINANYTPVKVNADKEFKLARQFGIRGVPDLRFLTPKGEGIARWPGYIETKNLLPMLQWIHTNSYKTIKYKDFLVQRKE
jgi:thioredoxin-related protein